MRKKLLLLHGALGSKKQLLPIQELLQKEYDVYSLDFEGHASFESQQEYSIDLFSKNVIDFLDNEHIEQVNLFGYSMGGYVALYTALHHPKRVGSIITLGTKLDWSKESSKKEVKMLHPDIIEAKVPHFAQKLQAEHAPQDWKSIMHKTARMMLAMGDGQKLATEDFKQISHTVTIGIGNADKMVSIEESQQVAELLLNGKLEILDAVEHPIDKVDPNKVFSYIKKAL